MKKPIFILPFDHRSSFAKKLLGFPYPTNPYQAQAVMAMKSVVFDGFLEAQNQEPSLKEHEGILVDLEFGSYIIQRAKKLQIPFAISTEKSRQHVYTFEYGDNFGKKLTEVLPTYAKALVRYDPSEKEKNVLQLHRLKQLSDYCEKNQIGFMFELLVSGKEAQIDLMIDSMKEILAADIKPTVWKLEGLNTIEEWEQIQKITKIDIIVLGRGEKREAVEQWITVAAKSGIPDGFAIGRTIFFTALERLRDKDIPREEAVQLIAKNYLYFAKLWIEHQKKAG